MLAPMIKIIIVLLSLAFKCRLVNETSEIALMQAGKQANHLTSAIGRAGNITKFTENRASKIFFFSRFKRDLFFNFCVCHKKGVSGKHSIRETNTYYWFNNTTFNTTFNTHMFYYQYSFLYTER